MKELNGKRNDGENIFTRNIKEARSQNVIGLMANKQNAGIENHNARQTKEGI